MNKHFSIVEGLNSFINSSLHKTFLLLISFSLTTSLWSAEQTVEKTMTQIVSENSYTVSEGSDVTCYTSFALDANITVSTSGSPNCGSFWGTTTKDWRLYQNQNGDVTISVPTGCELQSVTFTYNTNNGGVLYDGAANVNTGSAATISGTSATFTVQNTGNKTNGQVRITAISVTYDSGGSTKTLESIAVQTAPTKVAYFEGENFDPAGLVITRNYDTGDPDTYAYGGHESDFSFTPSTFTPLTMSNTSITITYGGKTTTQTITVSAALTYTVTWMSNGESYTTTSVTGGQKPTFPTNPTSCDEDESGSKTFYGWSTSEWTGKLDDLTGKTVYTKASDMPAVSGAITYYAVFCKGGAESVEINTTNSGVTGTYADLDFEVDGINFLTKQWMKNTNIQAKKDQTLSLYNKTAFPENITSITVEQTGTARAITIHGSNYYNEEAAEAAGDTYVEEAITQPATDATMTFSFAGKSFPFFYMSTPGNAVYMDKIVINYGSEGTDYMTNCTECNENVTIYKGLEENGTFEVSPTGKRAACDHTVVVTVTPTPATGYRVANNGVTASAGSPTIVNNGDGTWTVTYAQHTNVSSTINVAFEAIPCRTYTFNAGSGTCTETTKTETLYGNGVTLPVATPPSGCDPEFTFAGWSTSSVTTATTTRPTTLYAANTTYNGDDLTLYAVYAQGSGISGFTLSMDCAEEEYFATGRSGSNTYMGASTNAADAATFDIVEKDSKKYLVWLNNGVTTYVSCVESSAALSFTTSIDEAGEWYISDGGAAITIQSVANNRYFTFNSNTNQRDRFAGYLESTGYDLILNKGGEVGVTTYHSLPSCVCISVDITYDANGGTLASGCSNVTGGTCDIDWQLCAAPTRDGYVFAGWKDQRGTLYEAEEEVHALHSSLTLTAQWIENPYTVNFDAGNGSCSKTSLTENSRGDGVKLPIATPVGQCADEWHFVGWTKTQLIGDDNTSYIVAGVANQTYVPETNNETLYAVYSTVDVSGEGDVEFSRYTASSIEEGLYVLVMYQMEDSYGRLKYSTLSSGRIPYDLEYTYSSMPSSITINSPSLSDYVFQLSNTGGKWMLYNLGNENYLGAGSNGNLTWSVRTPSLVYTATKESSSSHWWKFQYDDGDKTYFLGPNKGSDFIRNYSAGTLSDTYCIALYKGAAGTTYYSCSPQCDECTDPGWSFHDGDHVVKPLGSPVYTNRVDKTYESTGAVLYKSSNEDVATVNASNGEVTLLKKGSTVITLKLGKTSTYCAQVLQYELEVKDPNIDVVEINKTTDQNNPSDPNEYYGLVVEHDLNGTAEIVIKERETTLVGEYANDLFISKYFEAASNMKLFAIFNGTDHDIPFSNIRVRSNCSEAGTDYWTTAKGQPGYVELKDVSRLCENYPDLMLPKGTEIIFWSNNFGTGTAASNNTTLRNCINMTIDGRSYNYDDMKNDNIPNWYCLGDKKTYNTVDGDGNNQFIFNGDDSMILERYNSETGQWEAIDLFGAGTSSAPYSVAALKEADQIKKVTTSYLINGHTQALNDDYGFYAQCAGKAIPYSTNRYMLIRKKEVKDGLHAVDANKTSFATLCEEWDGTPVGGASSAYCYSGTCFGEIAQYDFAKEYVTWIDLPPTTLSSFDNGDGTQTILVKDMADRACHTLLVSVVDASDKVLAETEFKIPIIVDAVGVETDDDLFYNQHDACESCDVIVMPGATLTKAADNAAHDKDIIRNLDVYAGAKVVVPTGTNYHIGNLTLRTKVAEDGLNLAVPEMVINGNLLHKAKAITQRMRVDDRRFYNFIVPYSVRKSQIAFANGASAVYGEDYIIDVYDGENRASSQAMGNWVHFEGETLHPGVGYTLAVAPKEGHTYAELVFPMPDGDLSAGEPATKSLYVNAWGTSETRANHKGWNLIGNPYLQIYGNNHLYVDAESMLTTGKLIPDDEHPGWWKNDGSSIPYVTVINATRDDYTQEYVSEQELPPFTTFFVQVGKPETASGTKVNLTFDKTNRKVNAVPRFMTAEERPSITRVGLYIAGSDKKDNFGLVIGEQYTPAYEMQADLSKEFGSVYSLKGYTLQDEDNLPLAFHAINPERIAQPIPVGVRLPANDTYTFSIDKRYDLSAFEHIWLNDNVKAKYVDLLEEEEYSFEGTKSQIDNRFSLTLVFRPTQPSSIDNFMSGILISGAKGTLRLTGLPENADIYVYDMAGRMIESTTVTKQATAIYHVPAGVYQVRVLGDGKSALLRTIVY